MKIAISTNETIVSDHFGHCEAYTMFSIDEKGKIVNTEILTAAGDCGCKSNIAETLRENGVKVLLTGNMGGGAYNHFCNVGIRVYRGCSGEILKLADDYIQGKIIDNGISCHHHEHEENHQCHH
jgi:predicted Fe-Mo cluster-binding NifX family protein